MNVLDQARKIVGQASKLYDGASTLSQWSNLWDLRHIHSLGTKFAFVTEWNHFGTMFKHKLKGI